LGHTKWRDLLYIRTSCQHLDVDEVIAEKFELYRSIWRECGHIGPMPHTFLMRAVHEAQSPADKLPEGEVVFFLLATVPRLDLQRFYAPYEEETRGAPPFDTAMMVCLLLYASCVGVFSSRKRALACERHLAFRAMVGQERPDFRTISDVRTQHVAAFKEVVVQVMR